LMLWRRMLAERVISAPRIERSLENQARADALTRQDMPTDRPMSDAAALTRAVQRGDAQAFEQFYERYCDRLHRLIFGFTRGNETAARDILQTLMIRLTRKLPVLDAESELWSWLARAARNATVDHYRRIARSPLTFCGEVDQDLETPAPFADEEPRLDWLDRAIAQLDPESQWLLRQFYFEKRSHQSLADELGKSAKAVESRLARIRGQLRLLLNQQTDNEPPT
jgi:RNA polymerase sigma factor (sigma-70 family)